MTRHESLFVSFRRAMRLRLTWYNRPRQFDNGIVWVRIRLGQRVGPGLWWRDSRIAGPSGSDAPGRKFPLGPYRIRLLGPQHD